MIYNSPEHGKIKWKFTTYITMVNRNFVRSVRFSIETKSKTRRIISNTKDEKLQQLIIEQHYSAIKLLKFPTENMKKLHKLLWEI